MSAELEKLRDGIASWSDCLAYASKRTGLDATTIDKAVDDTAKSIKADTKAVRAVVVAVSMGERFDPKGTGAVYGADDASIQNAVRRRCPDVSTFNSLTSDKPRVPVTDKNGKASMALTDADKEIGKANTLDAIGKGLEQRNVLHKGRAKSGPFYWRLGAGRGIDISSVSLD